MSGYRRDSLTYEWNSGVAATKGLGIWSWGGSATSTRTISVKVLSGTIALFEDSRQVVVEARTVGEGDWEFQSMTHPPYTYGIAEGANAKAWGGYGTLIADPGAVREGSGPWMGEYYTHRPIQLEGRMLLHPDFDTIGQPHGLAHKTCSGVPVKANVLTGSMGGQRGGARAEARGRREQLPRER